MPNSAVDAPPAPNPASYTDNGDGTVTDNVTRLVWQQATAPTTYTWSETPAYCRSLCLGGHADWRVPSIVELATIVDFGKIDPAIDTKLFHDTRTSPHYWSSTRWAHYTDDTWAGGPEMGWGISFSNGFTTTVVQSELGNVRCVR
jgi:hypothetical protein